MKILVSAFFPRSIEVEGIGRVVTSLAESFQHVGHEVTVVAPFNQPDEFSFSCINYQDAAGSQSIFQKYAAYKKLAMEQARASDAVFAVEISPSFLMSSSCFISRVENVFLVCMGIFLDLSIFWQDRVNMQNLYHYLLKNNLWTRFFASGNAQYIVSTHYQKHQLQRRGVAADKIHIIPFGINPEQFTPADKKLVKQEFELNGEKVISYIGHFSPVKGVPNLLRAYQGLSAEKVDSTMAIAWSGRGRESKATLRMIRSNRFAEKIKLYGRVDVPRFLSAVDMLVLPYLNASIPHFPLLILEAFALGVPVVTTNVGGLSEIIKNEQTGILVEPGSPRALADGVRKLLESAELAGKISRNGRALFEQKFNSFRVAQQYSSLITG